MADLEHEYNPEDFADDLEEGKSCSSSYEEEEEEE